MAQNDLRNPAGAPDASRQTTGTAGHTGTTGAAGNIGGTVHTDAVRPVGATTTTLPPVSAEPRGMEEGRSSYAPTFSEVEVTERRSRPSSKLVIGSVVAGAIAGGAIPFMLSGRKSRQSEDLVVRRDERSRTSSVGTATSTSDRTSMSDRSSPRGIR